MTDSSNTIRLHRVLRSPPARVYRAFLEPDALVKWMAPHGFTARAHSMDASVGGNFRMSFTNFSTGSSHFFGGAYTELVEYKSIRYTDKFEAPGPPGEMQVSISLQAVSCGTELDIVQQGVPAVIPPEACYLGWQESLNGLARLVEPEIPDGA